MLPRRSGCCQLPDHSAGEDDGNPDDVRQLLAAANYVHVSALWADGSPRYWVVWVGLEGDYILVCAFDAVRKARTCAAIPRVALPVTDFASQYRVAAIQGEVVEVRPDEGCSYMDPIPVKYTGARRFSSCGPDRVCL